MKRRHAWIAAATGLIAFGTWSLAQQPEPDAGGRAEEQPSDQAGQDSQPQAASQPQQSDGPPGDGQRQQTLVQRGRYIVHHVAMCIYCHTPREEDGEIVRRQLLHGARMPVESPFPEQQWCFYAPKLAGLPGGWSRQDMVKFLQSGVRPGGTYPRPPMPPFRMTEQDARAVAAYLESLR